MEIRAVKFRVQHEWRVGGLYHPTRPGTTAAVLMLHGFPGVQKNEDIAAELCRRGMTVFLPHFRGCWGSPGRFSLRGLLEDAGTALRLLSRYHHVDSKRVGVLGYSVGGWVALKLAAQTPVATVAALSPALPRRNEASDADYLRRSAKVLNITSVKEVWKEYVNAAREEHPYEYMRDISPTPLLLVQGLQDRLVPPGTAARLWSLAAWPKELLEFPKEDHEFQNDRPAVVDAVCGWMQSQLAGVRTEEFAELVDVGVGD